MERIILVILNSEEGEMLRKVFGPFFVSFNFFNFTSNRVLNIIFFLKKTTEYSHQFVPFELAMGLIFIRSQDYENQLPTNLFFFFFKNLHSLFVLQKMMLFTTFSDILNIFRC